MSDRQIEIRSETTMTVEGVSPERLAQMFMNLDSNEIADFFRACAAVGAQWEREHQEDPSRGPFFMGHQMMWLYVKRELRSDENWSDPESGWAFVLDLAAPFYAHFEPGDIWMRQKIKGWI